MDSFLKYRSLFGSFFFIRVPYSIGDLKRDPNSENYPYRVSQTQAETQPPLLFSLAALVMVVMGTPRRTLNPKP